jgi:tol-pal system protein YbgF
MVGAGSILKSLPAMIRSALLLVVAFACMLGAEAARAQDSPSDLLTRIDRLEATIRSLTGNVEQLQYRNQQLEQQVQRLQAERQAGAPAAAAASPVPVTRAAQPYTPPVPPAPVVAAAPPPVAPLAPGALASRRGDAFDPTLNPNAPGAPRPLGTSTAANEPPPPISDASAAGSRPLGAPLDLSTLSASQAAPQAPASPAGAVPAGQLPPPPQTNTSATGAMQAALPPSNTAKDEYDLAYGYVMRRDYVRAADAFRVFLRQYPSDRLASEAQYWLGESFFQQQQYRDAAESFLAVSTKYETTARAPEALLRLGQSLAAMGEKEAACASLGEVLRKYPHVAQNLKQSVEREQKRGHC